MVKTKKIGAHIIQLCAIAHSPLSIEWIIKILLLPLKIIIYNQNSIKHSRKITAAKHRTTADRWGHTHTTNLNVANWLLFFFVTSLSTLWRSHLRPAMDFHCITMNRFQFDQQSRDHILIFQSPFCFSVTFNPFVIAIEQRKRKKEKRKERARQQFQLKSNCINLALLVFLPLNITFADFLNAKSISIWLPNYLHFHFDWI